MNKKELKEVYYNVSNQPRELFVKSLLYFIKIMCSKSYPIERKEEEFKNLAQAYLRCKLKESDKIIFLAISDEFQRRKEFEELNLFK